jgi:hypothetical protein
MIHMDRRANGDNHKLVLLLVTNVGTAGRKGSQPASNLLEPSQAVVHQSYRFQLDLRADAVSSKRAALEEQLEAPIDQNPNATWCQY